MTQAKSIDNFTFISICGNGKYGKAYKAVDTQTNEIVCVKVAKESSACYKKVFENDMIPTRENLDHPNILKQTKCGEARLQKNGIY